MGFIGGIFVGYAITTVLICLLILVIVWSGADISIQRTADSDEKNAETPREQSEDSTG